MLAKSPLSDPKIAANSWALVITISSREYQIFFSLALICVKSN